MILKILDDRACNFNPERSLDFMKLKRHHFMDLHPNVTGSRMNRFSDYSNPALIDKDPESIQATSTSGA
jgi:hypothetical protein